MPLLRLNLRPGVNAQSTQTSNRGGWFSCNRVRWRNKLLEKLAGWQRLFSVASAGIIRFMHAYLDLRSNKTLLIGTDAGAQVYIVPAAAAGSAGTLYSTTLYRRNSGFNPLNVTGTPTVSSRLVTVNDPINGTVVGEQVSITISVSVGGQIIPGGTSVAVASVVDANNWTFLLAAAATNTNQMVVPQFTFSNTSATVTVLFKNHGLGIGSPFVTQVATVAQGAPASPVTLAAGSYAVASVVDADHFTIVMGVASPTSVTTLEGANINTGVVIDEFLIQYIGNPPSAPENWYTDNLGNFGLISFTNSPIYVYTPPATTNPIIIQNSSPTSDITSPQVNAGMFVAMPQAQVIAFGSEVTLGGLVQDPLLLRFSDAGSYEVWVASATNQAGSYRLGGSGSRIVGGIQAPQTTLIWTDVDIWSMSYVGPPFIYSFTTIATGCGLIASHAQAILGRTCLWMSLRGFFTFSDSGVVPIDCPVWNIIFDDLDPDHIDKIFMGTSSGTGEIWIFYPSVSGGAGECDKYVKVNVVDNLWDYGALTRSAWLQESEFGTPLGADSVTLLIQQHEQGYDDDGSAMSDVFAETGYSDIADGNQIMYLDEFIQDMKWFGSYGAMELTIRGVNYPGESATTYGPFGLDSTNRYIRPELRKRQIALRFDWLARKGFSARLGTPRVRAVPAGRRP